MEISFYDTRDKLPDNEAIVLFLVKAEDGLCWVTGNFYIYPDKDFWEFICLITGRSYEKGEVFKWFEAPLLQLDVDSYPSHQPINFFINNKVCYGIGIFYC